MAIASIIKLPLGSIIFLLVCISVTISDNVTCPPCNIECSKQYIWIVGDTLTWNCTLQNDIHGWTSTDIHFKRTNFSILPDNIQVLDNRTTQLIFTNATLEHAGSYFAYIGKECEYCSEIEMQTGKIPTAPDVEIIYQVISDVAEYIQVSGKAKNNDKPTIWDIHYNLNARFSSRRNEYEDLDNFCAEYKKDLNKGCFLPSDFPCTCPMQAGKLNQQCMFMNAGNSECFLKRKTYSFLVTMVTEFGNVSTIRNTSISDRIARAPKVSGVLINTTSRKAEVSWSFWSGLRATYRISVGLDKQDVLVGPVETDVVMHEFNSLIPNKHYVVKIEAKLRGSTIWGDPETQHFQTKEDAPDSSPRLSPGSYMYTADMVAGQAMVLYTQKTPVEEWNGNLTGIAATIRSANSDEIQRLDLPANETVFLFGIPPTKLYFVDLQLCTEAGCSSKPSVIRIPPSSQAPLKPVNIVAEIQEDRKRVKVSWEIETNEIVSLDDANITLHWCKLASRLDPVNICVEGYEWITIPGNVTDFIVDVKDGSQLADLVFGVSLEIGGLSSGVAWGECLYDVASVPGHVTNLQAELSGTGKASVSWSPPGCEKRSSYPTAYQVSYVPNSIQHDDSTAECDSGQIEDINNDRCSIKHNVRVCESPIVTIDSSKEWIACVRGVKGHKKGDNWQFSKIPIAEERVLTEIVIGVVVSIVVFVLCIVVFVQRRRIKGYFTKESIKIPQAIEDRQEFRNASGSYQHISETTHTENLISSEDRDTHEISSVGVMNGQALRRRSSGVGSSLDSANVNNKPSSSSESQVEKGLSQSHSEIVGQETVSKTSTDSPGSVKHDGTEENLDTISDDDDPYIKRQDNTQPDDKKINGSVKSQSSSISKYSVLGEKEKNMNKDGLGNSALGKTVKLECQKQTKDILHINSNITAV